METQEIQLRKKLEAHAKKNKIKLNPDGKILEFIIKGLLKNKKEKGEYYCPCRIPTGDKQEDEKIICPCVYNLDEIKEKGHCHCNLFIS